MNNFLLKIKNKLSTQAFSKCLYWLIFTTLGLYVFSIPSFAGRIGFNIICYILMAILIGTTVLFSVLFGVKRQFDKRSLIIFAFIASSFVGTIAYSHQFRGILTLFLLSISFFAIYFAMMIINNNKLIIHMLTVAFFVFALYYLYTYKDSILNYASYEGDEFRLGWEFENPNTVGSFMILALSLSAYIVVFQKGWLRFFYAIPSLVFLLVGFTTGSRTFLISIFIIALCYILFLFKKHLLIALCVIIATLTLTILLINNVPFLATFKYRFEDTIKSFSSGGASGSTLERVLWQKYGFYLGSRRIVFGFGESGFAYASGVMTYTHGNFTEMLCDFGIVGFSLFYCFNLAPALFIILSNKKEKAYVFTILVVFLLSGLLTVYYYDKCTYVIMALCYYLLDNAKPIFGVKNNYYEVNV